MLYNMQLAVLALVPFFARLASPSPVANRQAIPFGCTNITIPVTVSTSQNMALHTDLDTENFNILLNPLLRGILNPLPSNLFDEVVSGTFSIGATYCEPLNTVPGRENTLQILVHGISYTRACKET